MKQPQGLFAILAATLLFAACGDSSSPGGGAVEPPPDKPDDEITEPPTNDPGTEPWELVPRERVAEECGLDPDLLQAADERLGVPWAAIRYGKLCHEFYPDGPDRPTRTYSATKTLGAVVTGMVAWETRNLERTGPGTGPLSDEDRVDHWLEEFSFNPDAKIAHVLAMVAFNEDLSFGAKVHDYDAYGDREINRLSDILNTAIQQDPERLGANLEEFTQRYLFEKLGMRNSTWSDGEPDKIFGVSWHATVRDMARLGTMIQNGGMWNGERLLDAEWIYRMIHPAFEDANTSYGYLTWLESNSNYNFGGILGLPKFQVPFDPCTPAAIHKSFPHGVSAAPDCNYEEPWTCEQQYDVGVWAANGAGGQLIIGQPGLDLVLVGKQLGSSAFPATLWGPMRPSLVAEDPRFQGDEAAFCAAYGAAEYAPAIDP